MFFYDKSSLGFYQTAPECPSSDYIEVTEQQHRDLMEQQECGKLIRFDGQGLVAVDQAGPDQEELNNLKLVQAVANVERLIATIEPAVSGGYASQEDAQRLPHLQRYRYELSQIKLQPGWPDAPQWPQPPEAMA